MKNITYYRPQKLDVRIEYHMLVGVLIRITDTEKNVSITFHLLPTTAKIHALKCEVYSVFNQNLYLPV